MKETKASTQQDILTHWIMLNSFINGMLEFYHAERDDDYWASVKLPEGAYVDVNLHVYDDGYGAKTIATVYPVNGKGEVQTQYGITLREIPFALGGEQ